MVMGRNDTEPLYNMSRDLRKQTLCICENKDAKPISVFVFAKRIVPCCKIGQINMCYIPSFMEIGQMVLEMIFKGFQDILAWPPSWSCDQCIMSSKFNFLVPKSLHTKFASK